MKQVIKLSEEIRAYASRFVSFLLDNLDNKINDINQIILYGSVAKGTATKKSDVDIFIDTKTNDKKIKEASDEILENFYKSRDYLLFKTRGVDNEISLKVGKLRDWRELHKSITATGKVLWGDFKATETPVGTKHMILLYWDKVGKSRTSFLNKLYGFKTKGKELEGLIEKWNGEKTGKSSVIIPFKYKDQMFTLLKEYEVNAKSKEVFVSE